MAHGDPPQPTSSNICNDTRGILERNQRICSTYARLYLAHPEFKWVGASAFSCHRVGVLLSLYDLLVCDDEIVDAKPSTLHSEEFLPLFGMFDGMCDQLELIRRANNAVFAEINATHQAYIAPDGGLAAVEAMLANQPTHHRMLDSFRLLDRGIALRDCDPHAAQEQIWESQMLLADHEQRVILQPIFAQMGPGMQLVMSTFSWMDFGLAGALGSFAAALDWNRLADVAEQMATSACQFTSFFGYMYRQRLGHTDFVTALPDFCDFDTRWQWVRDSVLPLWRTIDSSDAGLRERLVSITEEPLLPPLVTRWL